MNLQRLGLEPRELHRISSYIEVFGEIGKPYVFFFKKLIQQMLTLTLAILAFSANVHGCSNVEIAKAMLRAM